MSVYGIPGAAQLPQTRGAMQPIAYQPQGQPQMPPASVGMTEPEIAMPGASRQARSGATQSGRAGSDSSVVRAVKAALRELGLYDGPINGTYDARVRQSVLAFQKQEGIARTGKPNARTRKALKNAVTEKAAAAAPARPQHVPAAGAAPGSAVVSGAAPLTGAAAGFAAGAPMGTAALAPGSLGAVPFPAQQYGPPPLAAGTLGMGIDPSLGLLPRPAAPTGPQMNATNQQGLTNNPAGADQSVTNRNHVVGDERNRMPFGPYGPYGAAYGAPGLIGWNSGMGTLPMYPGANPHTAPGASMVGAHYLQNRNEGGGIGGWFRRLLD